MGKVSLFCVLLVFALLLEDGSSVKKKTEDEKKEDEELAKVVNRTLAEEEKRREEDEKKKRTEDETQGKKKERDEKKDKVDQQGGQSEAGPSFTCTCPEIKPCRPCQDCPVANCTGQCNFCPEVKECPEVKPCLPCDECGPCPEVRPCKPCKRCEECPLLKDCRPCPEEKPCKECPKLVEQDCPPCQPCRSCGPCPKANNTGHNQDCPAPPPCLDSASMSVPVALAVGASAGVLLTGVAAAIGLILRYVNPIASGFLFMATIVIIWYLCSHYPETARELGARAATLLREAATALSHRVMEAIQRHNEQVGFPILLLNFEFQFSFKKNCTKIFYVEKIKF
jgi:hypothetical protein